MSTETRRPTRREERRTQTVQEIRALALDQVSAGGPEAVSLSGIVRAMSMSPAAIYRYVESRDALLADLVVDAYDDFADALAAAAPAGAAPTARLVAVLGAARTWALAHPNRYRLVFQTASGSGRDLAPERTVSAASRSMAVLVDALEAAHAAGGGTDAADRDALAAALDPEVVAWGRRAGLDGHPPRVLRLALTAWTRLHGVISLELGGHLGAVGVDPGALYAAEVAVLGAAVGPGGGPGAQ
ncbi:TetR-like C-terminal domain-containing protein [Microlunatus capsulatus]|uniref:TetR/AcrR family transcriptional regulator n=1 Tax=Microlunatus capsulatus TaxID=99117 RepID=UPI0031D2ADBF